MLDLEQQEYIVGFICGRQTDPGILAGMPKDALLEFCRRHRIVGDLIAAVRRSGGGHRQLPFYEPLLKLHARFVAWEYRQRMALSDLMAAIPDMPEFIVVKGNVEYLRDGNLNTVRPSVDVDFLSADPSRGRELLAAASSEFPNGNPNLAAHEFWNFASSGCFLDAHIWVPCVTTSTGRLGGDYPRHVVIKKVFFADIRHASHEAPLFEGRNVLVPGPAVHAFLTAVTVFRDYQFSNFPFMDKHPPVKVGDLLALHRALTDERFEADHFRRLTAKFKAEPAISWAVSRLREILGDAEMNAVGERLPDYDANESGLVTNVLFCHGYERPVAKLAAFNRRPPAAEICGSFEGPPTQLFPAQAGSQADAGFALVECASADMRPSPALTATVRDEGDQLAYRVNADWSMHGTQKRLVAYNNDEVVQFYFDVGAKPRWMGSNGIKGIIDVRTNEASTIEWSVPKTVAMTGGKGHMALIGTEFYDANNKVVAATALPLEIAA